MGCGCHAQIHAHRAEGRLRKSELQCLRECREKLLRGSRMEKSIISSLPKERKRLLVRSLSSVFS